MGLLGAVDERREIVKTNKSTVGIGEAKPHEGAPEEKAGQQSVEGRMIPFEGACAFISFLWTGGEDIVASWNYTRLYDWVHFMITALQLALKS